MKKCYIESGWRGIGISIIKYTNVSSWIFESKVKKFCTAYKFLLKAHRDGFLKALACDHAVDHLMVCKAAKSLLHIESYYAAKH